ncbi:hypothetical protein PJM29_29500, partial [Mycobacterium kansasii]
MLVFQEPVDGLLGHAKLLSNPRWTVAGFDELPRRLPAPLTRVSALIIQALQIGMRANQLGQSFLVVHRHRLDVPSRHSHG